MVACKTTAGGAGCTGWLVAVPRAACGRGTGCLRCPSGCTVGRYSCRSASNLARRSGSCSNVTGSGVAGSTTLLMGGAGSFLTGDPLDAQHGWDGGAVSTVSALMSPKFPLTQNSEISSVCSIPGHVGLSKGPPLPACLAAAGGRLAAAGAVTLGGLGISTTGGCRCT